MMSEANLLTLLPPRQTAQPLAKPVSSKPEQPTAKATSFSHKLEKAKKEKSDSPVKKPVPATAQKQAATAKTTAQPEQKSSTDGEETSGDSSAGQDGGTDPEDSDQQSASSDTKPQTAKTAAEAVQPVATKTAPTLPRAKPDASKKKPDDSSTGQQNAGRDPRLQQPVVKQVVNSTPPQDASNTTQASASAAAAVVTAAPANTGVSNPAGSTNEVYGSGKVVSARDLNANQAVVAEGYNSQSSGEAGSGSSVNSASLASASAQPAAAVAQPAAAVDEPAVETAKTTSQPPADTTNVAALGAIAAGKTVASPAGRSVATPTQSPQAKFVEQNQPKIVSSIQGQLLPSGGTMQIKLNPEELGSMQVTVHMHDGVMSAAFETSSDHATKLLSHSLGQLKSGLEASGMTVEKLQVTQAPKQDAQSDSGTDSKQAPQEQQQQAQQDQQRREMVQRMWRKLSGVEDPLDMVA
jgi:flagellar hook-length control protein FliK